MSARSFPMQASWPSAVAGGGPVGASVRHIVDLARFFPGAGPAWPDALAAETRRHIAGCLNDVERALRAKLASGPVHDALSLLEGPFVWPAVQAQPQILSAELVAHMRARAAVSLIGRQAMRGGGDPSAPVDDRISALADDPDPRIIGAAARLAEAESRWTGDAGEDGLMQADLPAEYFAELAWTAAAMLGHALSAMVARGDLALDAASAGAERLLAGHCEEEGALARAGILARLLRGRDDMRWLAGQAIAERRPLLFAALAADAAGLEIAALLDCLVAGSLEQLAASCRMAGASAEDFGHLLVDLKIVRAGLDDDVIVVVAQKYDRMTAQDATDLLAPLRQPPPFRAKLALIDHPAP